MNRWKRVSNAKRKALRRQRRAASKVVKVDLSTLNVPTLLAMAKKAGLPVTTRTKKAELLELLD